MALFSFVFFTGLVGLLTWLITRRSNQTSTSEAYFLAGRSLTFPVIAGSLLLTNLSTEQMVGLNGAAFTDGLSVMAWEVIAVLALVLMALFFLPRFLKLVSLYLIFLFQGYWNIMIFQYDQAFRPQHQYYYSTKAYSFQEMLPQ